MYNLITFSLHCIQRYFGNSAVLETSKYQYIYIYIYIYMCVCVCKLIFVVLLTVCLHAVPQRNDHHICIFICIHMANAHALYIYISSD